MRWTIRAKLTALVFAVLLPLMAAAGVKFWLEVEQGRESAQSDMIECASAVAQLFDEILIGQIENLEALAGARSPDRIRSEDLVDAATRIKRHHGFVHRLVAVLPDGTITAASDPPSGASPAPFAARDVLRAGLRDRQAQVGAPQPSSTDGRLMVPIVVPMLARSGAPLGAVAAEIDLTALSAYLDRVPLMHGTSATIVTGSGVLVVRTGANQASLGRALQGPGPAEPLIRERAGVAEWRWEDGVNRLTAAAPMARAPWVALGSISRDLAYAPATAGLRRNVIGLGIVTLVALGAAWLISRRMTRSVRTLIDGARGLAAGTGRPITVPTADELGELAAQLNQSMDERRAAEAAVAARQHRIRALADINRSISQQLDLEPLLQQITRAVAQLTGAHNAVLWEVDPAGQTLRRRTATTDPSVGSVDLPPVLTFEQGGAGWIARHRQALFVEDVATDARIVAAAWALSHDLVAFAGAPVVAGDELLGVLTLNLKRGMLPQGDERMLLSSFASQAAVAINNARLFAEAEARRRVAETLGDLGRALSRALDVNVVARLVADGVCTLLGGQASGLFRLEADSGDLVSLALSGDIGPAAGPSLTLPAGTGASALAIRERRPVTTTDILTDPRITLLPDVRALIEGSPHRSVISVPLVVKDVVIGALAVADRAGRIFEAEEIRTAQAFADQAALALDNARLYEEAHHRVRHLDSLRDVVEQILVPISLEGRLTVIAGKAAELFGADRAAIALRDGERDALVVRAGHGLAEGEVGRELRPDAGVLSLAATTRAGTLVNDYQAWPQRDPYVIETYTRRPDLAVIGYPLMIRDQLIGAIAVGLHTPGRRFVRADLDRLASLAVPAALAIEHSRLYEELQARVRELEATQAQLLQAGKLSAVGQLVSGVAHELNNPLSVILGYAQLLSARDLPADVRRPVEMMLAQGGRMAKIVQSLLLFSRQRKAERGAVDVREAIEQPLSLRATQLMLSGIRVSATYGEGVPPAEGDAHQLQQVFLNLILNAEQAILGNRVGGQRVGDAIRITTGVRVDQEQTWVVITVADNGPGIPRDALRRIFEPFFTTKKVGEGTGLGLSVSYGIVQQHGGRLSVESRPGHTVFTIELPAATSPLHPRAAERAAVAGTGAGRGRHALVVDDEPGVLDLVAALLRQAGWEVATATGGRDALERLRGANYDLVLADMRMPDGSGEDLYRAVASERGELTERFLFMTGDTANPEAWRFIEATHAPVIEKPFTAQALLSAVERVAA
jgi:signal transduction histidine kinase